VVAASGNEVLFRLVGAQLALHQGRLRQACCRADVALTRANADGWVVGAELARSNLVEAHLVLGDIGAARKITMEGDPAGDVSGHLLRARGLVHIGSGELELGTVDLLAAEQKRGSVFLNPVAWDGAVHIATALARADRGEE